VRKLAAFVGNNAISSFFEAIANRDQLDRDKLVANMDRDNAPELARHPEEERKLGDRVTQGRGTHDQAARTDLSNARAAVRSLVASRNRVPHSAKLVGTLRVARHQPQGPLAVQYQMAGQSAGAELVRHCTAETPLARER
jgi:hypothetical protein